MGRLTKRIENGIATKPVLDDNIANVTLERHEAFYEIINKLAHYEDMEEQGRLIELPCAVGDTVYELWYTECHNGETHPGSYGCCGCEDKCDMKRTVREQKVHSAVWLVNYLSYFGSHYFFTKEEAEAKLKELEGDKE